MGFGAVIKDKEAERACCAGAAARLVKFGIIPELVGRLPVITALRRLTSEDALVRVLKEPKNAWSSSIKSCCRYDDVELDFDHEALEAIADKAIERKIGARGLRAVMEGLLTKSCTMCPSDPTIIRVTITKRGCGKASRRAGPGKVRSAQRRTAESPPPPRRLTETQTAA